jgi:hypothetical protein
MLMATTAAHGAAATGFAYRVGSEYHRRSWESYRGDHRASQLVQPVDASLRLGPQGRASAGFDLAWSDAKGPDGDGDLAAPREARFALEQGLRGDRLRLGLGLRRAFGGSGLTEEEARVAQVLDEVALGWPRARVEGGTRVFLEAAAQPLRRPSWLLQLGLAREWRGRYELVADGRRVDPGGVLRAGLGVVAAAGARRHEISLQAESGSESEVAGGWTYEVGPSFRARGRIERAGPVRWGGSGLLLLRGSGRVPAGAPLDRRAVRGGNAVRGAADLAIRQGRGELRFEVGGAGVRGFPGDLGQAEWVEAGVSWSRPNAAGSLRLSLSGLAGNCRDGRPLRGWSAGASLSGAAR